MRQLTVAFRVPRQRARSGVMRAICSNAAHLLVPVLLVHFSLVPFMLVPPASAAMTPVGQAAPLPAAHLGGSPVVAQTGPTHFVPPVEAEVLDPFRPPTSPYGPGNRGIEYATVAGQPVIASSGGVVAFAGLVAGELYVSIDHAGGLRTTYSYLASIEVAAGAEVRQGDQIGLTSERSFHFGARLFGAYIDPALLFASPVPLTPTRARLVPATSPWT